MNTLLWSFIGAGLPTLVGILLATQIPVGWAVCIAVVMANVIGFVEGVVEEL